MKADFLIQTRSETSKAVAAASGDYSRFLSDALAQRRCSPRHTCSARSLLDVHTASRSGIDSGAEGRSSFKSQSLANAFTSQINKVRKALNGCLCVLYVRLHAW